MSIHSFADLHCDTALEIYRRKASLLSNELAISAEKAKLFDEYIQVFAIWSDKCLDNDSAYKQFFDVYDYFTKEMSAHGDRLSFITPVLAVEDARILNGDISRLRVLYNKGVRFLTLLWAGETCIGGAHDKTLGLTPFGKDVVRECIRLRIVPDVSHASQKATEDILEICTDMRYTAVASHSDSYTVFPHPRNISDRNFMKIKELGGLIGINLFCEHLGVTEEENSLYSIVSHIEHFLSLGGENTICFGCDFDGAVTPKDFKDISCIPTLAEELSRLNYSNDLIEKIFYLNVKNFIFNIFKDLPRKEKL